MRNRAPLVLSIVALVFALLGGATVATAQTIKRALFASNAGAVSGIRASKTPKAGYLLPLGPNRKFPTSVVPAGPRGLQGPPGPQGPQGPAGTAGSITGVAAGGDLAGTYPNPTIGDNKVVTAKIADNAVTTAKHADNSVTSAKIADASVTLAKHADNSVDSTKVVNNSLRLADYAIANGTVNIDFSSVAATTCQAQSVAITGAAANDIIILIPPSGLEAGLTATPLYTGTASGSARVCNITAGAIDPAAANWAYIVLR